MFNTKVALIYEEGRTGDTQKAIRTIAHFAGDRFTEEHMHEVGETLDGLTDSEAEERAEKILSLIQSGEEWTSVIKML